MLREAAAAALCICMSFCAEPAALPQSL
eukprot:COSAG06_NODE_63161_length_263_cov_0.621951_1_plen_27_part_10